MDKFHFGQSVCLRPEVIKDFIAWGYIPHDFNPDTIGKLDVPKNNLSSYQWMFCYGDNKRIGVDEEEVEGVIIFNGKVTRATV